MRTYTKPTILAEDVKVEAGFQTSTVEWELGAPGGEIDVNDYEIEL
ncbi:MAG: hypothetical protein IJ942_04575 [Alistipes sp.]|nr:hypothetical protein [Alistipes sp.]